MNEIQRRRRAILGEKEKQWETESLSLGDFDKPAYTVKFVYNAQVGTLYIKSSTERQYHGIQQSWAFVPGYEYKLEYDVDYVSGTHLGGARQSDKTMYASSGLVTTSKHIVVEFQYNANIAYITLFDTVSTSQIGEMTYSNFSLKRRPI